MYFNLIFASFGAVVGLSLGMTGTGGSILVIPLLVYGAGLSIQKASFVSLLTVCCVSLLASIRQTFRGQVNWRAAILFSISGIITSPFVVTATHHVNEKFREGLLILLMLGVAWRMLSPGTKDDGNLTGRHKKYPGFLAMILGGTVVGALSGFLGIGGGFLIVPLLVVIFEMSYKEAVSTSLASIVLISGSALVGYFNQGMSVDPRILLTLVAGGVAGVFAGNIMINVIPGNIARWLFAATIIFLAVLMLVTRVSSFAKEEYKNGKDMAVLSLCTSRLNIPVEHGNS